MGSIFKIAMVQKLLVSELKFPPLTKKVKVKEPKSGGWNFIYNP